MGEYYIGRALSIAVLFAIPLLLLASFNSNVSKNGKSTNTSNSGHAEAKIADEKVGIKEKR